MHVIVDGNDYMSIGTDVGSFTVVDVAMSVDDAGAPRLARLVLGFDFLLLGAGQPGIRGCLRYSAYSASE
jgi:hypothetical protein